MMTRTALAAATLVAFGAATGIVAAAPRVTPIDIVGKTKLTTVETPTYVQDTGTVTGSPVGSGNITLNYRMVPPKGIASITWVIRNAKGTLSGSIKTNYVTDNVSWTFTGVGRITAGTGAYKGVRAYPYSFYAKHSKLGKHEAITMQGTAQLPGRK